MLDEWRGELLVAAHDTPKVTAVARCLWRTFLEAALIHPRALLELAEARAGRRAPDPAIAQCPLTALHAPWLTPGEPALLDALIDALEAYKSVRDRALVDHLLAEPNGRFVVFLGPPGLARSLYETLRVALGQAVRLYAGDADVVAFNEAARVLVCDARAEEGLNLHRMPATVVHHDLPLAVNRLEQRIGRLDRIGARKPVRSLIFDDDTPFATAWLRIVHDDIGVFSTSIASLQYVLDDRLAAFLDDSFENGTDAFVTLARALRDPRVGLEAELARIRAQEALDALEFDPDEAEWFEALEDFDSAPELEDDLEAWLVGGLQFKRESVDDDFAQVRYRYCHRGRRRTLVPLDDWSRWYSSASGEAGERDAARTPALTFSRQWAYKRWIPLVRVGHPLFDGAVQHANHDERGVAFAMWRWRRAAPEGPSRLALRFDFLVEALADPALIHDAQFEPALRRRLDDLFPPAFETIWLDEDLELIDDPTMLDLLAAEYETRAADGRDYNLRPDRWEMVEATHPVLDWSALVRAAEVRASTEVRAMLGIDERSAAARQSLATRRATMTAQLEARLARLEDRARFGEAEHLARESHLFDVMLAALAEPRVRLDAVGAIFLASWSPFAGAGP